MGELLEAGRQTRRLLQCFTFEVLKTRTRTVDETMEKKMNLMFSFKREIGVSNDKREDFSLILFSS